MKIRNWKDVSSDWNREEGGERWVRIVSEDCFLSYLYRMTGFGYMESETALRIKLPVEGRERTWRDTTCDIVLGDRREQFNDMTKEELVKWYADNADMNRNSMGTIIGALKEAVK